MGDRRPSRFRLPWLNRPAPSRPVAENQVPTRPTATVPVERPPFRPPGIAPVQSPPPPSSRAASQPPSPPPTSAQSKAASPSPSPSRAAPQSRPASPSRIASQPQSPSKTSLQPQSPSRLAPQPVGRTSSQPSSPSRTAARVQPTAEVVSLPPPSPSDKLKPTNEVTSQPPPISTQAPSFATQQEGQEPPPPPRPFSQETPSKTEIKAETVPDSQNQPPVEATTQPDGITTQDSISAIHPLPDSTENPDETKEGPKVVQEQIKEKELNWPPNHKKDTELPTVASNSETHAKEQLIFSVKELGKQEILEKRETSNTFDSNGRVFRTGNSIHPKERNHKHAFLNGERLPLHKEVREDITKSVHKLGPGDLNQTVNGKPINVITLAGENRGATMQIGTESANKERPVHIHRGYKINPDESVDATTDADESSRRRSSKDPMNKKDQATKAYINNNVLSINNSIVFNTSVSGRNPGVQLDLSQSPTQPIRPNGKIELLRETYLPPVEKLTYQPIVRRRCLRGLLMEPSDSDPDNPDKPRRHGCRYDCWEKGKDIGIGRM